MRRSQIRSSRSLLGIGTLGSGIGTAIGAVLFDNGWTELTLGLVFSAAGLYLLLSGYRRDRQA